ncbi:MAG: type III pantothenate kinase [Erysipelotrichaceae bacterium]|nr:type III pantothenate kinase [Erysipelotrichaceae bacterium]
MLLTIDMGNSNIEIGLLDGSEVVLSERVATDLGKTASEYAVLIHSIFEIRNVNIDEIEGGIISSVVPPLTYELRDAVKKVTGKTPLIVEPGIKTGMKIRIDDPRTLGADLLVGAVAAEKLFGAPAIIIDMGTATTVTVVDKNGNFVGGVVMPGVALSLNALSSGTSKLPKINLTAPKKVVCTTTEDCMSAGMVYGQASMLDGLIDKMEKELGYRCNRIATGGLARLIVPYCEREITLDNNLMLEGLKIIYDRNRAS